MLIKIDHKNSRILSHIPLSPEAIEQAKRLLDAGNVLHIEGEKMKKLMPADSYFQFFGMYDCLKFDYNPTIISED